MLQDLLFLGLLKDGAKHGYQIKKRIHDVINNFANVETKSIYYPLQKLEKEGFIVKHVGREGNRPERYVYELSDKGRKRFLELLDENFSLIERPYFNVDLSLYFLPYVSKETAVRRLQNRQRRLKLLGRSLEKMKSSLSKKKSNFHLAIIAEHGIELLKAEIAFIDKLVRELSPKKEQSYAR